MQFVLANETCYGLALDIYGQRLYFTEYTSHAISSITTYGRYYTKLVNDDLKRPISIVLDTRRR